VQRGDVLVRPLAAIERERKRQEEPWNLSKEDGGGESVGAREGKDSAPSGQRLRQKPRKTERRTHGVARRVRAGELLAISCWLKATMAGT
jgi:hypothetical protein